MPLQILKLPTTQNKSCNQKKNKKTANEINSLSKQPASHYLPKNGIFLLFLLRHRVCMYVIGSAYASVDAQILQSGDKLALQISNSTTTMTTTQSIRPPSSFLLEKRSTSGQESVEQVSFARGARRPSGRHSRLILNGKIKEHANYGGRVLGGTGSKYARTERAGGVSYDALCCRCV